MTGKALQVSEAISALMKIGLPEGDVEGDALNSEAVLDIASDEQSDAIHRLEQAMLDNCFQSDGKPNGKVISTLLKQGVDVKSGRSQDSKYETYVTLSVDDGQSAFELTAYKDN